MNFPQVISDFTTIVNSINGNAKYFAAGSQPFIFPGLFIKAVGEISFPLTEIVAKEIIKQSVQAPFGKGSKTIVDTNIRNTWEIDAADVEIKSPNWEKVIENIVQNIKSEFEIEAVSVKAELYKMLLYEKGSFFTRHQDTEREKGMFATLVVVLPSFYEGGEFEIFFDGKKEVIDVSRESYNINFISFYADCEHAILPIKNGYRIVLVYNLIKTGGAQNPAAFIATPHIDKLHNYLVNINLSEFQKPLALVLDHQYTPENFSWNSLKGNDLVKAEIIRAVAEKLGWYFNMALITHHVHGEPDHWDYGYHDIDADTAVMGEVFDESTSIEHWCMKDYPSLDGLDEAHFQMINAIDYESEEPYEKQSEGYMGNSGPELEFCYHNAILIIAPFKTVLPLLYEGSNSCKINWIKYLLKSLPDNKEHAIPLFHSINVNILRRENDKPDGLLEIFAKKLIGFSDHPLNERIISWYFERFSCTKLVSFLRLLTLQEFQSLAAATFKEIEAPAYLQWIKIWTNIYAKEEEQLIEKIKSIESKLIALLPAVINQNENNWYSTSSDTVIKDIINQYINLGDCYTEKTEAIIEAFSQLLTREMIYKNFKPVFSNTSSSNELLKGLERIVLNLLQALTTSEPYREPTWLRFYPDQKHADEYQKLLQQFCSDSSAKQFEYRAAQDKRSRVENYISCYKLDISCSTVKKGTPHTLVLTKNENSYYEKMEQYAEDVKYLAELKNRKSVN